MKMNDELIKIQQQLTNVLNDLIEEMQELSNVFLQMTEAEEPSGDGGGAVDVPEGDPDPDPDPNDEDGDGIQDEDEDDEFEGPELSDFEKLALVTTENTEAVKDLVDANGELINALNNNTGALLKITNSGNGNNNDSGEDYTPVENLL
jgi:hypothetical protein